MNNQELFGFLKEVLDRARVPYMITGSFASSFHGSPRSTQDIDIVIATDRAGLDRLLSEFPPERFYASAEAAREALAGESLFNVIDSHSGWKIDFIMRKSRSYSREAFDRRAEEDFFGTKIFLTAPEDILIAKLEWAKETESERQIEDVAGILIAKKSSLDFELIHYWVDELGIKAQWQQARKKAGLKP